MKVHFEPQNANLIYSLEHRYLQNIWIMYPISYYPLTKEYRLTTDMVLKVYLEFENCFIEIYNSPIESDSLEDFINFSVETIDESEIIYETENYKLIPQNISGNIGDFKIINDRFIDTGIDELIDVDIALKFTVNDIEYCIMGFNTLLGDMTFLSPTILESKESEAIRHRIEHIWDTKKVDWSTFMRNEIDISARL